MKGVRFEFQVDLVDNNTRTKKKIDNEQIGNAIRDLYLFRADEHFVDTLAWVSYVGNGRFEGYIANDENYRDIGYINEVISFLDYDDLLCNNMESYILKPTLLSVNGRNC